MWKSGVVKLLKKGDEKPKEDIKSYRPVTLLPVMGKMAERVVVRLQTGCRNKKCSGVVKSLC